MPTSHGVVQGYIGSAAVDSKCQVIVHAEAFGQNQEKAVLKPMLEGIRRTFEESDLDNTILENATILADTGYHSEENLQMLEENKVDAYIADTQFRKRDERFKTASEHRKSAERNKAKQNEGIDWKAVSHAFRAGLQLKEIYETGDLKYPLRDAAFIRDVKTGVYHYANDGIGDRLDTMLCEVEELAAKSSMPERVDSKWLDTFVLERYAGAPVMRL